MKIAVHLGIEEGVHAMELKNEFIYKDKGNQEYRISFWIYKRVETISCEIVEPISDPPFIQIIKMKFLF